MPADIYLAHPHTNVNLRVTLSTSMSPVTFTKVPPLDKVIEKLGPTGKNPIVASIRDFIALRDSQGAIEAPLQQLSDWATFLQESFTGLPAATLFPLVDLFRVTLSDPRVSGWFAEEKGNNHELSLGIFSFFQADTCCRKCYNQSYAIFCYKPHISPLSPPSRHTAGYL